MSIMTPNLAITGPVVPTMYNTRVVTKTLASVDLVWVVYNRGHYTSQ